MGIIRTFIVSAWGHQYKEYKNSPMDFFCSVVVVAGAKEILLLLDQ
jgi:hypothetical protein